MLHHQEPPISDVIESDVIEDVNRDVIVSDVIESNAIEGVVGDVIERGF